MLWRPDAAEQADLRARYDAFLSRIEPLLESLPEDSFLDYYEKLRTASQSALSRSDWTNQTPSVLNRPSSLIPSESPPPPPISPSSPAESTAKVRVHPSACFHIPHPTLNPLRATTTHRAAAPFPLSSPLARADAD